jgi:uncharacterized pyridoxamine 5'-phosphate oxidase family protein
MKTRNVKISIETAERWCNGTNNELKELAVQTYPELAKKQLPKSWEELKEFNGFYVDARLNIIKVDKYHTSYKDNKNIFATKEQAKASIAMAQLSQLMKVYNDGWNPDWSEENSDNCVIFFDEEKLDFVTNTTQRGFLSLKDYQTAELFIQNFRELIETAKPLL